MLFSDKQVAQYINNNFEPVWQSVRPVPTVKIDFGNGHVVNRTLHGNIATYVCSKNGIVMDILPGLYEPQKYIASLAKVGALEKYLNQNKPLRTSSFVLAAISAENEDAPESSRSIELAGYHRRQADSLEKDGAELALKEDRRIPDVSKLAVERRVKVILAPEMFPGPVEPVKHLKGWDKIAKDTDDNERVRRLQIHKLLAASGPVTPNMVTKQLYRDILHADLDDPYLGLGPILFNGYPLN